jgi:hypothetical protein
MTRDRISVRKIVGSLFRVVLGVALLASLLSAYSLEGSALKNLRLWGKTLSKERQDFVTRRDGWLTGFVDQVGGNDAMRAADVLFEEGRDISAGGAVRKHASDEAVAEPFGIGGKALGFAKMVSLESIGEDGEVLAFESLADGFDLARRDLDTSRVVEG